MAGSSGNVSTTVSSTIGTVVSSIVDSTDVSGATVVRSTSDVVSTGSLSSPDAAVSGPMTGIRTVKPAAAATLTPIRLRCAGRERRTGSAPATLAARIGGSIVTATVVGGAKTSAGTDRALGFAARRAASAATRSSNCRPFGGPPALVSTARQCPAHIVETRADRVSDQLLTAGGTQHDRPCSTSRQNHSV
jgi:hypothetical protein